jgi:hypothetical protein
MTDKSGEPGNWWATLPGILTAAAAVITAVTGLLAILAQNGVLGEKSKNLISWQNPVVGNTKEPSSDKPALSKKGVEVGVSEAPLPSIPVTGAVVTMANGSIVKLRDDIREWCHVEGLQTVEGQTIKLDLMKRFDVLDWSSQKGTIKVTLNNGQIFSAKIEACEFRGRNDLGDFRGDFDKIRSVEFVR